MSALLEVEGLSAGYGTAVVLEDVSFSLDAGEGLAVLGRNGMGKTTLIDSLIGVTQRFSGRISVGGVDLSRAAPRRRVAAGIAWVPQGRGIFRSLSVEENITAVARGGPWTLARLWQMFPRLAERRANRGDQLSGGEQQMLAVARALALDPKLMLLDEPLEGLAPLVVEELLDAFRRMVREEGVALVLVEQTPRKALAVTDRAMVLERGRIVLEGASAALAAEPAVLDGWLGVG